MCSGRKVCRNDLLTVYGNVINCAIERLYEADGLIEDWAVLGKSGSSWDVERLRVRKSGAVECGQVSVTSGAAGGHISDAPASRSTCGHPTDARGQRRFAGALRNETNFGADRSKLSIRDRSRQARSGTAGRVCDHQAIAR